MKVSERTYRQVVELSKENGLPVETILDRAVEAYRSQTFIEGVNADFAKLRSDPEAWA